MDIVNALVALMETNENEKAAAFFGDAMKLALILTNHRKDARIEELEDELGSKELALRDALDALSLSSRDDLENALKELEEQRTKLQNLEALVESMKTEIVNKDARIEDMKTKALEVQRLTVERDRLQKQVVQLTVKCENATDLLNAKSSELERSESFRHDAIANLERLSKQKGPNGASSNSWDALFCKVQTDEEPPVSNDQPYDLSGTPLDGVDDIFNQPIA